MGIIEMTLHEAINAQLQRMHDLFIQAGEWTSEQYLESIGPLHEALRLLAEHGQTDEEIKQLQQEAEDSQHY